MDEIQKLIKRAVAELGLDVPILRAERLASGKYRLTLYGGRIVELSPETSSPSRADKPGLAPDSRKRGSKEGAPTIKAETAEGAAPAEGKPKRKPKQ